MSLFGNSLSPSKRLSCALNAIALPAASGTSTMKKLLLSSVALFGLTVGATAADLPRRVAPVPYVPVPVFTWTGFYIGVNAGYGWTERNDDPCRDGAFAFTSACGFTSLNSLSV